MPFTPAAHPGQLHHFAPRLFAFELNAAAAGTAANFEPPQKQRHTLLFLGGLGDDLMHPSYPSKLPPHLPPSWTVAELHLRSSGSGWTTSSLARDADDLASAVAYFRGLPGRGAGAGARVVLMGHSTGAQTCMEYLTGAEGKRARPRVDGVVLQAGVSDREGLMDVVDEARLKASLATAKAWVAEGRGEDVLPNEVTGLVFGASPCARRWISLADRGGDDDYFSSDLGMESFKRTFGRVGRLGVPMLCLFSAKDENMPGWVDKEKLLGHWKDALVGEGGVWDEGSGTVPKASHNLNKSEAPVVQDLCQRIANFLARVERDTAHAGKKSERL